MHRSALDLIDLHLDSLYDLDDRGRVVATRETGNDFVPRFVLVRSRRGHAWRVGAGVPDGVAAHVEELAGREPRVEGRWPAADREYRRLLGGDAVTGPAYVLTDELPPQGDAREIGPQEAGLLERHFPATAELYAERRPVVGIVEDGAVVSRCCSARRASAGVEAGVDTAEGYRRRGYAVAVTAGWARALRRLGRVPLYSTEWDNVASLRVADRLGARRYAVFYEIA